MSKTDIAKRRICWPSPDATCLEGGCLYCNEYPMRHMGELWAYVRDVGELRNRGGGTRDAQAALGYGQRRGFGNVDVQRRSGPPPVETRPVAGAQPQPHTGQQAGGLG